MLITLESAKNLLRVSEDTDDDDILALIASIAAYMKNATGRDWDADAVPNPVAVHVMRAMLVKLYDDRSDSNGKLSSGLGFGITNWMAQLQAVALSMEGKDNGG